jgi:hypothetical protein
MKKIKSKRSTRVSNQLVRPLGFSDSKRSQQEILGFVLIVVLVTVMGVVFLSFSIGKSKPTKQTSAEISNLLEASMYHTTDCAVNYVPQYREVQDLIKECYKNPEQQCLNGLGVCHVLESTLKDLIDQSLKISEDSPNKAYNLKIYYTSLNSLNETIDILLLQEGIFKNCSSKPGGNHLIAVTLSSGTINTELEVCRGEI